MGKITFLKNKTILVKSNCNGIVLHYDEILYFHSDKPYIEIKTNKNKLPILITSTINFFSNHLPPSFYYCNRSTIINLHYVSEYKKENRHLKVTLNDNSVFRISQKKRNNFIEKMQRLGEFDTKCTFCIFAGLDITVQHNKVSVSA
jgi:DNA-binding LytR/AlgR family response regulator